MCGINVLHDAERSVQAREEIIARMNAEMVYRGPDGDGIFSEGPATIGMRRLSIIDLEGGQQPLFNEDRSLVVVCNGEIYNHVELRAALVQKGHRFATGSDCETILHLYEEYGDDCLDHLRGMFAFALWDTRKKRLLAARDRLGIKPLYMVRKGRSLALSSELKTLVRAQLASSELDHDALHHTLRYTYPLHERRTLARDIERVPPGTAIVADEQGVRERRYWTPRFAGGDAGPTDEELGETLAEAVRIHLRSDVPVAVLLSAGLDSAAIAAISARAGSEVTALSAGYAGQPGQHACDERVGARETARALGLRVTEIELNDQDFPALFDDLTRRCDEPPCDIASMAIWALYRACREKGYEVVLSGVGGDEIFFGYPTWNRAGELMARRAPVEPLVPPGLKNLARRAGQIAPELRTRLGAAWPGPFTGLDRSGVFTAHERMLRSLGADRGGRAGVLADDVILELERRAPPGPDAMYAFLVGAYLPNNGFLLADKLGMGNSVEVRVPFADHVLFERIAGLPLSRRFTPGETKPLLKRILRSILPAEVLGRPKQGFTPPSTFVRTIVQRNADAILSSPDLRGWLATDRLRRLLDETPAEAEWLLYSLAAFVKSREAWR